MPASQNSCLAMKCVRPRRGTPQEYRIEVGHVVPREDGATRRDVLDADDARMEEPQHEA
jgi:hypothetical protein